MAATFLGQVTIGGALVGLSTGLNSVELAFEGFRATVAAQVSLLDGAVGRLELLAIDIEAIGSLVFDLGAIILDAKAAIRIPAGGDLVFQIAGILQGQASLTVALSNPAAYLSALVAGAAQALANLQAAIPSVQITGQLTAAGITLAALQLKLAAIDAALALLDIPAAQVEVQGQAVIEASAQINVIALALGEISASLTAALAAVDVALAQLAAIQASLGTAGAYALIFTGPLANFGVEMNAALATAGVAGGTQIYAPVVFVLQSDAPAVSAVNSIYLTS